MWLLSGTGFQPRPERFNVARRQCPPIRATGQGSLLAIGPIVVGMQGDEADVVAIPLDNSTAAAG